MDSGWGFGPLVESVQALAEAGVQVLAVAGRDQRMERRFRELAARSHRVTPFGYTDRIPELMAAADLVIALPGAITCAEARVVGRQLLLLDVMPGHGRDNLLHELELGGAHACVLTPQGVTASVLALRGDGVGQTRPDRPAPHWEPALVAALQRIGLDLQPAAPADVAQPAAAVPRSPVNPITSEDAMRGAGSR
jgi:predicted glycosyltransferase